LYTGGVPSETEGSSRGEYIPPCGHDTQHCQAVPEGEDTEQGNKLLVKPQDRKSDIQSAVIKIDVFWNDENFFLE